ncbi:hypothetical protein NECAME_05060 [Necator americanus]|uniref:Uncharacterized protein n=1 Tax=Necator americanus TaxID=51031 RepID=W2SJQ6_NECAM|nr:hypothetical protein NECAME_05060 [Necator americanus]ETN69874.1 hypothetical protein NECAME_05060 [Necator americanus]
MPFHEPFDAPMYEVYMGAVGIARSVSFHLNVKKSAVGFPMDLPLSDFYVQHREKRIHPLFVL